MLPNVSTLWNHEQIRHCANRPNLHESCPAKPTRSAALHLGVLRGARCDNSARRDLRGGVEQSASLPQSAKTNYFDNSMDAASTCIGVFGALLLFAGAISLSLVGNDRDKHDSTGYWIDIWLFSGILTTAVGFVRGLKAATADRKSPKFPLLIILFVGLILTVTSFVMQFSI
jgi:hypothetical protein